MAEYENNYLSQVNEREKEVLEDIKKILVKSHLACSLAYIPLKDIYQIHSICIRERRHN